MNNIFKIHLSFLLLITASFFSTIKAVTGDWKVYSAFQEARLVAETPKHIFAAFDGSLLSYTLDDNEVRLYSKAHGLSDVVIEHIKYSKDAKALVIVYNTGNIDIIDDDLTLRNVPDLYIYTGADNKTVNNVEIIGRNAFLSTAFGIVNIDITNKVSPGFYKMNINTRSICEKNGFFYVATDDGIRKADKSSNLLDSAMWKPADDILNSSSYTDIDKLFFYTDEEAGEADERLVFLSNGTVWTQKSGENAVKLLDNAIKLYLFGNKIVTGGLPMYVFSGFELAYSIDLYIRDVDCMNDGDTFWVTTPGKGLCGIKVSADGTNQNFIVSDIVPNSPKRNLAFNMTFCNGRLFVAGGGRGTDNFNLAGTLMIYEDGKWLNIDEDEISAKTGFWTRDFLSVGVDPTDSKHYFVASWGEGLYEFRDDRFVNLYSLNNSSLQSGSTPPSVNSVRVNGPVFDKNNNLYVLNNSVPKGMSKMTPEGVWTAFSIKDLNGVQVDKILIDKKGYKWINIWRHSAAGIVVLDEKDEQVASAKAFFDQNATSVDATMFLCVAEDKKGDMWIGTDNGPIIIPNDIAYVNAQRCYRRVVKDHNGTNQYMLDAIRVNAIAIDGGNRKWMGTQSNGLYVVDESSGGEPTVENYTSENSPLLSNHIYSLAINPANGELFIGTDVGICSIMTGAAEGKTNYGNVYAFPNPVRPDHNSLVTVSGLMKDSSVKITDMAGNLITEGQSQGGQFTWDLQNRSGKFVKAGIYLVFAASATGEQGVVTKIMVLK